MAVKTNTTESIKNPSTALSGKIEKTTKNLKSLAARAGCGADPVIEVEVPGAGNDDVLYIGLNAVDFYFKRGEIAKMPLSVAEVAANTGKLSAMAKAAVVRKRAELAAKAVKKTAEKTAETAEE